MLKLPVLGEIAYGVGAGGWSSSTDHGCLAFTSMSSPDQGRKRSFRRFSVSSCFGARRRCGGRPLVAAGPTTSTAAWVAASPSCL